MRRLLCAFRLNRGKESITSTLSVLCQALVSHQQIPHHVFRANSSQDMVFIGPNDLAFSLLGYVPAKGDEPEFLDAIDRIVEAARKHGKWVARLSNSGALCKEHLDVFDTVALSYDVRAIQNWYAAELKAARG